MLNKNLLFVCILFFICVLVNAQSNDEGIKKNRYPNHPSNCCHNILRSPGASSRSTSTVSMSNQISSSEQDNQVSSSGGNNQRSSSRRENQSNSSPRLGTPTPFQQTINMMPAVLIPLVGKSFKIELGGDTWIAKVNNENYMSGSCVIEEIGNKYIIKLKTTHVWSGVVEDVIDLLQKAGVPLGSAETPLKTAAKLASKIAKWIPLKFSTINLDYSENRLSFVKIEK